MRHAKGGVDTAAIHPPGWDPNSTDTAFAAVPNYPGRFAIRGSVPLESGIGVAPGYARLKRR
jgi:hypothetical protein